jgi:hypothetical protein
MFLDDFKPMDSPVIGRHQTATWQDGTGDTHFYDRIEVGQPNLDTRWQRISSGECEEACSPPRVNVAWGTRRDSYYMEQFRIQSPLMCLTQLRYNTRPGEQIAKIYRGLKKLPQIYSTDFLRVHAVDKAETLHICGSDFATMTPNPGTGGNITGQLTTISLGSAANLPKSELTFSYLDYLSTSLGLEGYYEAGSGLPDGLYNLITDPRTWFRLTSGNPSLKEMMCIDNPEQASALYKVGQGVQKPFGNYAPTLDKQPIRFQHLGGGVLQRVYPYENAPGDTGLVRKVRPAYLNARYQLSYLWHPKAIRLYTPQFKKQHEKIPTVNSAMFGNWTLVNPEGVLKYEMPDGTDCEKNNDERLWFYWLCALELGFKYEYPELIVPILHLVDGSGKDSTVDSPVCGSAPAPQYPQYGNNPLVCEA